MRILIVEDEERIASFLIRGLRAQGYAVTTSPPAQTPWRAPAIRSSI